MKRILYIILLIAAGVEARSSGQIIQRAEVIRTISDVATSVGVPVELMLATAWVESSLRTTLTPRLDGATHSYGVFQIKLETAQWVDKVYKHKHLVTSKKLNKLYFNAYYACKYMRLLLKRYNGNWRMAADAYNKGRVVSVHSQYVKRVYKALEKNRVR